MLFLEAGAVMHDPYFRVVSLIFILSKQSFLHFIHLSFSLSPSLIFSVYLCIIQVSHLGATPNLRAKNTLHENWPPDEQTHKQSETRRLSEGSGNAYTAEKFG